MANKLDITALFTDNSARVVRYVTDPKATGDTNVELTLEWPEIDINQAKTLGDWFVSNAYTVINSVKADGISFGNSWYLAGQPEVRNNNERTSTVLATITQTTMAAEDFPYENRSDTAFYDSAKYYSFTETSKHYENSKSCPTMDDTLDGNGAITYGTLKRSKNKYGRYDGEATKRTYRGFWTGEPSDGTEIVAFRMWMEEFRSSEGDKVSGAMYIVREDKKYFAATDPSDYEDAGLEAAHTYVDKSSADPTALINTTKLGRIAYDEGRKMWIGYKVRLNKSGTTFADAEYNEDGSLV
jgi:hypothetical protein